MEPATKQYVTPAEMAAETGIKIASIRSALRRGEMALLRLGRGRNGGIYVRREEFEAWLQRKEQASTNQQKQEQAK